VNGANLVRRLCRFEQISLGAASNEPYAGTVTCISLALSLLLNDPPAASSGSTPRERQVAASGVALTDASAAERGAIERLRSSAAWVRRALAAARLARFDCEPSRDCLQILLRDTSWQVRCYALEACARRGVPLPESAFQSESQSRVIRTALRCRYAVPRAPLEALVERLTKSSRVEDKMLALELLVAADLTGKQFDREELLETIILRMDRVEAGEVSPRLSSITSGGDSGRSYRWREWYRKNKKKLGLHGGFVVPISIAEREDGFIASIPPERFVDLERHVENLGAREIDLAIMLDCTASMTGELAECQSGIDALMLFAEGVAKNVRVAVVAYRDPHDRLETQAWDFTSSITEARDHLWMLSAEGGGDRAESVGAALKLAYWKLSWRPGKSLNAVLIGDAPPHPGTGEQCVDMARKARAVGITTFAIAPHKELPQRAPQPRNDPSVSPTDNGEENAPSGPQPWFRKRTPTSPWRQNLAPGEVEYFAEIAEAGGGRAVALPRDASLIAEIAGITFGDRFQDEIEVFFAQWMTLCR